MSARVRVLKSNTLNNAILDGRRQTTSVSDFLITNNVFKNINTFSDIQLSGKIILTNENDTNISYGYLCQNKVTGTNNTSVGYYSMLQLKGGINNTALGANSMRQNVDGNYNTSVGINSLTLGYACNNNTAIGAKALYNSEKNNNSAVGFESQYVGGGNDCCSFGCFALRNSMTDNNCAFGSESLSSLYSENYNGANCINNNSFGYYSLQRMLGGANNNAFGSYSLSILYAGSNNTALGHNASRTGGLFRGSNNTFIGSETKTLIDSSFSTCLGYNSTITRDNQIVLGTIDESTVILGGLTTSIKTITSSTTLTIPLSTTYLIMNNTLPITITLPVPYENGVCILLRCGKGSNAIITVTFNNIISKTSTVSTTQVINGTSSSYVYNDEIWYQY